MAALAGIVVAPALPACKSAPAKAGRAPLVVDDDIDAIERQLAANADTLRSEGIRVARAEAPTPAPTTTADEDAADDAGGDGDDLSGEVDATPVQPADVEEEAMAPPADDAPSAGISSRSVSRERRADRRYARVRKKQERTRCERICDLADATCDLAEQICGLADRHVDEVRYEDACERAAEQCRVASTACTGCDD